MSVRAPWVGRDAELAALERALAGLGPGAAAAWAVSGEPGIGKSRLLMTLGARAVARRAQVFEGRAAELERHLPFAPFLDALDPYLASLDPRTLVGLSAEHRRLLGLVFPALAAAGRGGTLLAQERFHCYRAVAALLEVLAARRPLVLALDDLQWADHASLELLDHLLRRPPAAPVLLLLAHRSGFAPAALWPMDERIELGPLDAAAADALIGPGLDGGARAQVYAESGGNPFYLEHLALAERRAASDAGAGGGPAPEALDIDVPPTVRAALARELAEAGELARRVLQGAAVAGDPFTPELAAAVAGVARGEAAAALDRAIAVGLVAPADTPVWFRFRHPIVRRAVYASAGRAWRVGAHARAAEALAAEGAGPLARAHHVERSAIRGDESAVADLRAAGDAVAVVAPASAARWFRAALRLLPESAGDGRRLELLVPLASALGSAGRLDESRATLAEILGALPADLVAARVRLIGFMALIDRLRGRGHEARALLEQTLRSVAPTSEVDAGALELELAADRFFAGDWSTMRVHAARAVASAGGDGGVGLRASAAALLGLAEYSVGEMPAAHACRAAALTLIDAADADARGLRLDALDWLGWLEVSTEEYDAAREHFTRGLEIGRRSGAGHLLTTMSFGLVLTCTWSGRLTEAIEHSDATLGLGRLSGSDRVISWAHGLRALAELRSGALDRALEHGEQALRLSEGLDASPFSAVNGAWFGEALIESGQTARGREQVLRALGGAGLPAIESAYRPYFYDVLAGAASTLGRPAEVGQWAQAARAAADGLGLPGREGAALHAAALAASDPDQAASLALGAATSLAVAHPIESGRARVLAGRMLGEAGSREAGLEQLRVAQAALEALGARHLAAQAVRERRHLGERLGRGGRRSGALTGLRALSEREREVADLVQDRLTNRQIAQRLVLSEKTVERHLSRIFAKLDARSRVEVARAVEAGLSSAAPPTARGISPGRASTG